MEYLEWFIGRFTEENSASVNGNVNYSALKKDKAAMAVVVYGVWHVVLVKELQKKGT